MKEQLAEALDALEKAYDQIREEFPEDTEVSHPEMGRGFIQGFDYHHGRGPYLEVGYYKPNFLARYPITRDSEMWKLSKI